MRKSMEQQKKEKEVEGRRKGERVPHVLVFPFPAVGHVNCMLRLAQLLCLSDLRVTFLHTEYNYDRLRRNPEHVDYFRHWPSFKYRTISDGLPMESPRSAKDLEELWMSMTARTKPLLREMLSSDAGGTEEVTCIIADGILSFAADVGRELGIPTIAFRTVSVCSFWSYFCAPQLVEAGELPFQEDADLDCPIQGVPGMETFLRRRDLSSFLRGKELYSPATAFVLNETQKNAKASALIFNTFEDLEGPILSHVRALRSTIYTIGPLHALIRSKLHEQYPHQSKSFPPKFGTGLCEEDGSYLQWLDSKPPKSVVYVSFGSLTIVTRDELLEFWHGLVNSGKFFLWVIRPDMVSGDGILEDVIPAGLEEGTKERGLMLGWVSQEQVLGHDAVGGFLTHSGWNSTLESIVAGVPMVCWPYFADQQINSRFADEVWGIGLDIKDKGDRRTVEQSVRDLIENKNERLRQSADRMAMLARKAVAKGGSSYDSFDRLIQSIKAAS
ncbi:hypothetical protein H6P81_006136 [Aristolochia fimbriata]|uniref:Glycosyltransferase n=1 Tax=Aristolochia fimbriata TaxID=158543 RepID=A0AAV7EWM5_ARIFI|nr:hypothetical protein H6P81_006136 [Aristolochia fimbriata]